MINQDFFFFNFHTFYLLSLYVSGGLDVPDGETIHLDVRAVDVTDPQAAQSVPEMAALVTEGKCPLRV